MKVREQFNNQKFKDAVEKTLVFKQHLESNAMTSAFTRDEILQTLNRADCMEALPHVMFIDTMRTIVSDSIMLQRVLKTVSLAMDAINAFENAQDKEPVFELQKFGASYAVENVFEVYLEPGKTIESIEPALADALCNAIEHRVGECFFVLFEEMDPRMMFYFKQCMFIAQYLRNRNYKFTYSGIGKMITVMHVPSFADSVNTLAKKYMAYAPLSEDVLAQLKELVANHILAADNIERMWCSMAYIQTRIEGKTTTLPSLAEYSLAPEKYSNNPYMLCLLLNNLAKQGNGNTASA